MNKSKSRKKANIIPCERISSSTSSKKNNSNNKNSFDYSSQKSNSKSQKTQKTKPINIKQGERLYQKGIAYKNLSENKIKKLKQTLLNQKLNQFSFQPKILKVRVISIEKIKKDKINEINKRNKFLLDNNNNNLFQKSLSYTNIKLNNNSEVNNNINKSKILNNYNNKSNNLSIPKPNSNKRKKLNGYNASLKLYNDNKKLIQKRKEEIKKFFQINYPFKPRISKSQETVPAKNSFFERLENWINLKTKKQIKLQEEFLYDSQTGLRLFYPNLIQTNYSNSQIFSPKQKCLKLFNEFYQRKKKNQIVINELNDNIYRMANSTFFSPRSRILICNLMKKIFREIFEIISPNGIFIDNNNINLENIHIKILEIFLPLFQEIDNNNKVLNKKDFVEYCFEFYNKMNVYQKNILIEWYFNLMKKNHRQYSNPIKHPFKKKKNNNLIIQTDTNTISNNRNYTYHNTFFTNEIINNNTLTINELINTNTNTIVTTNIDNVNNGNNVNSNSIGNNEKKKIVKNKEKINIDICTFRPLSNESTSRISKYIELNSPSNNNIKNN